MTHALFEKPISFARRFIAATRGQVAMTFGLALIPMALSVGCGVDMSRAVVVKNRLGEALDAAGLAVGGTVGLTSAQLTTMAQKFFYANYPDAKLGTVTSMTVTTDPVNNNIIRLAGTARVDTAFMGLIGVDYLDVQVQVEVTRQTKGLEIALALDNTGSMAQNNKLPSLKTAATTLINILFGSQTNPDMLKMSLVPFSQTVRVDTTTFLNNGWMDINGQSSTAKLNFDSSKYAFSIMAAMKTQTWAGCLEARPGGLEELDTAPTAAQPDSRWVPYFEPDGPDASAYSGYTTYLTDGVTGNQETRLKNSAKYTGKTSSSPQADCNLQKILPLTNSKTTLLNYINGMIASGNTHIAIGAAWGWRTLSPAAPYTEGVAYDDPNWQKALVLLTDGLNTTPYNNTFHGSSYTAYNFLIRNQLGTTNGPASETAQDVRTQTVCQRIKDAGIRVYSILLEENSTRAKNLMKACASDPSLYFESPTASQLQGVFTAVAQDLSNLRLSK